WYNYYDGVKIGVHLNGNYMAYKHNFDATFWLNSGIGKVRDGYETVYNAYNPVSFKGSYQTATDKLLKGSSIAASARYLDGLVSGQIGFNFRTRSGATRMGAYVKTMYRPDSTDLFYLIHRDEWNHQQWNNTVNLTLDHTYGYGIGNGAINMHLRSTTVG